MPRQTRRDPRRTITPEGAEIAIRPSGFAVRDSDEVIFEVEWRTVRQVFAFTRFMNGTCRLCLMFASSPRKADAVVVDDRAAGWQCLVDTLVDVFPRLDREWPTKASRDERAAGAISAVASVVPAFTLNSTLVWEAD